MRKLWFKAKRFGWGWYPSSWQGWLITLVYIGFMLAFGLTINNRSSAKEVFFTFIIPAILLTVTIIRIAYATGERPRWRWGSGR